MVIIFIGDQAGRKIALRRLPFCHFHQPTFTDGAHAVDVTLKRWPAVEDVDIVAVTKTFFLQHRAGRRGLRMYLTDDVLGFLG
ncbi:Uncharacterised protein [Shigella sonnei]|nr:Uncharacterised protein [Shigella sonnei]